MKQFAIIGLGRFGSSLAKTLTQMGYEVLAIDSDEDKVEELADLVTHSVQANALDELVLKSLGLRNFDIVVVAIGQDIQANIMVTLMLKEMGVKKVVAKAASDLHGKVLKKIGADIVVFPEKDMGERVAWWLVSNNIIDQINLSPDYSLLELEAPQIFLDATLKDSDLRKEYGFTVLAIRRGNEFIISPDPSHVIKKGDTLIGIAQNEKLKALEKDSD
ncbi:MAG: TrkA family potassium uptake protein [Peptococcaceae bacterium]|nr:TrkA family potassium uptake protein [Peptococcaceae bacterium]